MAIDVTDYADLKGSDLATYERALGGLTSLERVLSWGRAQEPARGIEEILTQDEYTHDVIMPADGGCYLVFDTT